MSARRAALGVALLLGAAVAVVIVVKTPWTLLPTPPGGGTPPDPTAGLPPAVVQRAESFAAAVRPASVGALGLGLAATAALGLTPWGAGLVTATARALPRRCRHRSWVAQVVLGTLLLSVVGELVALPLLAYGELVRSRYGLSIRSWALWGRDVAVSTAIGAGTTALALLALVWLARRRPRAWWAWGAAGAAILVVAGSFLWPVVFEPAFNRFRSLPAGHLRTELLALADRNGTPVEDVLVSDASRRTTVLNAYVSGFGSTRRIVVYDTVLGRLPDDEIESIAAHELGHVAASDVLTGTLIGALGAAAAVALLGWLLGSPRLLRRAGATGPGDPRVVPLLLFLLAGGSLLGGPVQNLASRHVEARADLHALDLTGNPQAFVAMLQRLASTNLSDPDPPVALQLWFGTHPTTAERVAMARNWERLDGR